MDKTTELLNKANESSYVRMELMKEDYVSIKFSNDKCVTYDAGTTIRYNGRLYVLKCNFIPSYNDTNGCYDYDMRFDAWYYAMDKNLFKFSVKDKEGNDKWIYSPEWSLTDKPARFAEILAKNFVCKVVIDDVVKNNVPYVTCTFSGQNAIDALNSIVQELDPDTHYYEWWFDVDKEGEDVLHIGKLNDGESGSDEHILELGRNISNVSVQEGSTKPIKRLYVYGSTRNISNRYGRTMDEINATTAVSMDGSVIGYKDDAHEVKIDWFKPIYRQFPEVYSIANKSKECTLVRYDPQSTEYKCDDVFSTDKATAELKPSFVTLRKNSASLIPSVKLESRISLDSIVGINCTMVLVLYRAKNAITRRIDEDEDIVIQSQKIEFLFTVSKITPRIIETFDEFKDSYQIDQQDGSSAFWQLQVDMKANVSGNISINVTCSLEGVDWKAYTNNYRIVKNGAVVFNPKCLPPSDERSRVWANKGIQDVSVLNNARIPFLWFKGVETGYNCKITQRLLLPTRVGYDDSYIDAEDATEGGEGQVIFDEIYPTMSGVITEMSENPQEELDDRGDKTGSVLNYVSFFTPLIKELSESDFIEDPMIHFTSGDLNGMEFNLKRVWSDETGTRFCIIPNENYTVTLPNNATKPKNGDTFKLVGIDEAFYTNTGEGSIIATAQNELLEAGERYLRQFMNANQDAYTVKMIALDDFADEVPRFGNGVTIVAENKIVNTRVIGFQHPLDLPIADWQVICGNSPTWKRIDAMERKLLK